MNKNTTIGLLLIGVILIGSFFLNMPSKEERAAKRKQDSIALIRQKKHDSIAAINKKTIDSTKNANETKIEQLPDSIKKTVLANNLGVFALSAESKKEFVTLENELIKLKFVNKGGRLYSVELKKFKTYNSTPILLFDGDSTTFGFNFFANNRNISTNDLYFTPVIADNLGKKDSIVLGNKDSLNISYRLFADSAINLPDKDRKYIEYIYTIRANDYMIGFKANFVGLQDVIASNTNYINLDWNYNVRLMEKSFDNEKNATTIYYKFSDNEIDYLSETKDDEEVLKTKVKWISFKQQFFSSTLISEAGFLNANIKSQQFKSGQYVKRLTAQITLPYAISGKQSYDMQFYFGPNHYQTLSSYDMDLERQIPLGWSFAPLAWINRFAVIPVFNFLSGFNMNYGIIILILTILLKIVLLPIAYKTYLSSAKMKILKPEIDEIGKKFPKSEDAMKKQQATMALYKKAGVNPLAGCIPMLLQLPILIALFRFFPASFELRQQPFLWAEDLSTYDSILNLPFNIPFYGDHVSLFTLLMTISTLIYTKMNNDMMGSTNQMPGMKVMMYMMPIMFLGVFNSYSAGLSYYYFLANMFTFGQMFLIRRFVNEEKLHARIQENKKRPDSEKKSGFQKRLEEMAKQRGYKK